MFYNPVKLDYEILFSSPESTLVIHFCSVDIPLSVLKGGGTQGKNRHFCRMIEKQGSLFLPLLIIGLAPPKDRKLLQNLLIPSSFQKCACFMMFAYLFVVFQSKIKLNQVVKKTIQSLKSYVSLLLSHTFTELLKCIFRNTTVINFHLVS